MDSEGERKDKERSKHKKKSKDKDREKDRKDPSKKSAGGAAPFTANGGSVYHPAPVDPSSPPQASGDVVHISNGLSAAPTDPSREDVQSPAYSDISDANDQSPILDAEMTDIKKDKLTEALAVAPPVTPAALGAYGMYPFYSQAPFMVPPNPAAGGIDPKVKEERRESSGGGVGGGVGGGGAPGAPGASPAGAEVAKAVVTDPFKSLPANPHMQYPPFGFIPPYPAYPMDPLMVDPNGLRVSGNKTPEGTVHSPRLRVDMSPGRTKPPSIDDPASKDQSGSNNASKVREGARILEIAPRGAINPRWITFPGHLSRFRSCRIGSGRNGSPRIQFSRNRSFRVQFSVGGGELKLGEVRSCGIRSRKRLILREFERADVDECRFQSTWIVPNFLWCVLLGCCGRRSQQSGRRKRSRHSGQRVAGRQNCGRSDGDQGEGRRETRSQ